MAKVDEMHPDWNHARGVPAGKYVPVFVRQNANIIELTCEGGRMTIPLAATASKDPERDLRHMVQDSANILESSPNARFDDKALLLMVSIANRNDPNAVDKVRQHVEIWFSGKGDRQALSRQVVNVTAKHFGIDIPDMTLQAEPVRVDRGFGRLVFNP